MKLTSGYYGYFAALAVASHPESGVLGPSLQSGQKVPVGYATRKDGTQHHFHFNVYLSQARTDSETRDHLEKVWLAGALLTLGDALATHDYFTRAPELELLRHLRNGVAHGNTFRVVSAAFIERPSCASSFAAAARLMSNAMRAPPGLMNAICGPRTRPSACSARLLPCDPTKSNSALRVEPARRASAFLRAPSSDARSSPRCRPTSRDTEDKPESPWSSPIIDPSELGRCATCRDAESWVEV